jgi:hypothetical protein
MKEHGGHEDLRGLGHRIIIPYIHGRMGVVLQCDVQVLASLSSELGLRESI